MDLKLSKSDFYKIHKSRRESFNEYVEILLKTLSKKKLLKEYAHKWGVITLNEKHFNAREVYINLYDAKTSGTHMFNLHCDDFYLDTDKVEDIITKLNVLLKGEK